MPNPFAGTASNVCLTSAHIASKNSGDRNCGSRLESSRRSRACGRGLAWLGAAILLAACVPAAAQTLEPQWIEQSTANNPGPRFESALTYDAAHGQVVLFSGNDEPADTWVWNGINWSNVTPANPANSPSARTNPAMVYDAATGNVVLFGGTDNTSGNRLNDTWVCRATSAAAANDSGVRLLDQVLGPDVDQPGTRPRHRQEIRSVHPPLPACPEPEPQRLGDTTLARSPAKSRASSVLASSMLSNP